MFLGASPATVRTMVCLHGTSRNVSAVFHAEEAAAKKEKSNSRGKGKNKRDTKKDK